MCSIHMSWYEFERINLSMTSLLANQPVASDPECARDLCRSAAVTMSVIVNLSFSFLSRVSIVVSGIAIFRMVDNLIPGRLQIGH